MTVEGTMISMNHFKDNLGIIRGTFPDYLYLHGHSHNHDTYNMINACYDIPYYDVGVDANYFEPITFGEIFDNIRSWKERREGGREDEHSKGDDICPEFLNIYVFVVKLS